MDIFMQLGFALGAAAAANLVFVGAGFAFAGRRAGPAAPAASALALISGLAIGIVTLVNFRLAQEGPFLQATELLLTLAAGPTLLVLINVLTSARLAPVMVVTPAVLAALLLTGAGVSDIRIAVLVQMTYTAAAALVYWRMTRHRTAPADRRAMRIAQGVLLLAFMLHSAQLARMLAPHAAFVFAIVPAMSAAGAFIVLSLLARRMAVLIFKARHHSAESSADITTLLQAIDADPASCQPGYRLADLAAAAGLSATQASAVINRETGSGFVRFLNRHRVERARQFLAAPEESQTSIEAIAMLVGFQSRSAFYRAFAEEYGESPGVYRKGVKNLS